ncbi:Aste57867_7715 [Aphanomyces stellatus]|uniref:Aste57867_7715 protein n=1 Tax=Aphanomyces stellatus TaxID=120398 RepID=A0A485KIQ0_9STRA|nr:hypothetical protein As57867_007686 [Aphanomyces stellatus]VFT84618.1 Aste57867_7715 [Aphanomyces stellatus]
MDTTNNKGGKFGTSWSAKEDKKLRKAVNEQGKGHHANWKLVASKVAGRTPGACQGRWNTALDPSVDRSPWIPELDAKLLKLYKDPLFNSWSKRAAKLAEGKVGPNGEPMRRSGADTCDRYFKLTKSKAKKTTTTKVDTDVKWTDDTEESPETEEPTVLLSTAPIVPTRNQSNRARRNERRKKMAAAAAAAVADGTAPPGDNKYTKSKKSKSTVEPTEDKVDRGSKFGKRKQGGNDSSTPASKKFKKERK